MRNASENKRFAKEALRGHWGAAIGACLLSSLILVLANSLTSVNYYLGLFSSIAMLFVTPPISYGLVLYFMNLIRRTKPEIGDLFKPFSTAYGASVLTSFLSGLYTALWALLLIVPGIIKGYAYSMAPYLVMNNPNLKGNAAITESRRLMDGNKFRLFCLHFSFIGWILLSVWTFGILYIVYVAPYMQAATTAFYQELAEQAGIIPQAQPPYGQPPYGQGQYYNGGDGQNGSDNSNPY
jgi:uncharacterized membrane protein